MDKSKLADCYGIRHGLLLFRWLSKPGHRTAEAAADTKANVLQDFYSAESLLRSWGGQTGILSIAHGFIACPVVSV